MPLSSTGATAGSSDFGEDDDPSGPLRQPTAMAAYRLIMCGWLLKNKYFEDTFKSDASVEGTQSKDDPPSHLPFGKMVKTQKLLEEAKRWLFYTASGIPRLLFRGFHSMSGGGHDHRLNSRAGVIPNWFLNGSEGPTSMWDIPKVWDEMERHLCNDTTLVTYFSSWSQMPVTALGFAIQFDLDTLHTDLSPTIAVLDTESSLGSVYLSSDMCYANMIDSDYQDEYLVYGPITGPHYHCVSVEKLILTTRLLELLDWEDYGAPDSFGDERISIIEREAVAASRILAKALLPPNASQDKILMLTAKFMGCRIKQFYMKWMDLTYDDLAGFLYYVRDDLQGLATRDDARYISLTVSGVSLDYSKALIFEMLLAQVAENAVRIMGWTWRTAILRTIDYPDNNQEGEGDERELCKVM